MSLADTIDVALRAEIGQYASEMKRADDLTAKAVSNIDGRFKKLGSSIAALTGGLTIASVMQASVRAFSEAEQGAIRLDSVLMSMGRGTGELSEQLKKLASQIQSEGIITDDEVIRGQAMLATFDTISNEALPRATQVMADFAAMTGGDARTAAMLLGRASAGMTETLARYGIVLPDAVKKSGDFNLILAEMEKKIGGVNKALGDSASGSLKKFANSWDEVLESIGSVLTFGMSGLVASEADIKNWGAAVTTVLDFVGDSLDLISRSFMTVGTTLGAAAAQAALVAEGEFKQAYNVGLDWQKRLEEIWDPKKFSDRREKYMAELSKGTKFTPDGSFFKRDPKAEEDAKSAIKRYTDFANESFDEALAHLDAYNDALFRQGQALKDAADPTRVLQKELLRYDELLEEGAVDAEAWSEAVFAAHDKAMKAIELGTNTAGKAVDELSIFFEQAAKNIQDGMGSLLEDVLLGKVDNFEKAFRQMLIRIAAQLAASKIMELLMGKDGKSGLTGALAGAIGGFLTGSTGSTASAGDYFAGSAMGGSVSAGQPRMIGERGRELFVPKTDGMIVSQEQLARGGRGGGVSVTNHFNISAGVSQTVRAEIQALAPIIEERSKQGVLAAIERGGTYSKAVGRRA